jgi:hypothetical protein
LESISIIIIIKINVAYEVRADHSDVEPDPAVQYDKTDVATV